MPTDPDGLFHRLLTDLVRVREEADGFPPDTPQADDAARRDGGDFMRKVRVRAGHLPQTPELSRALARVLRAGVLAVGAICLLATLAGAGAAVAALGTAPPVSLPLLLASLVGLNLAMLLAWLLLMPVSARAAPGLGRLARLLWRRLAVAESTERRDPSLDALALLTGGRPGRWLLGSVAHLAWLCFALAALIATALLFSLKAYALAWTTTVLSPDALTTLARVLSAGPALLGVPGADTLPVVGDAAQRAREGWGLWLLAAMFVYGVLPRLIASVACVVLAWRALRGLGSDASLPGFARLRARLAPDHIELGIRDPAPRAPALTPTPNASLAGSGDTGALAVEWGEPMTPPTNPTLRWLGVVDDAASRAGVLADLRAHPLARVLIAVRATATPDRGTERFIADVVRAAGVPAELVLGDYVTLQARGDAARTQREADWQALARRTGVSGVRHDWPEAQA